MLCKLASTVELVPDQFFPCTLEYDLSDFSFQKVKCAECGATLKQLDGYNRCGHYKAVKCVSLMYSRFAPVVLDTVMGPARLARHT